MSSQPRKLTTTSYALLGLLALRPWSTYELAVQMRRNLHYIWPRAESNLYAEPKRLVDGGFANAEAHPVGRRRRTVYSITPAGREALERWLGEPAAPTRLESESLVKLMFAEQGSKDDLLGMLRRVGDDARARQQELSSIFGEYLRGEDPFPDRVHINVMAYRLLWSYAQTEIDWSEQALADAEDWADVGTPGDRHMSTGVLAALLDSAESDEAILRGMSAFDHVDSIPPRDVWERITARPVSGERLTLAVVELEPGAVAEEHSHEHEQLGILLRGSIRFRVADEERELAPGATWCIASKVPHRAEAGPDGATVIDIFSPPRSEWQEAEAGEPGPGRWP